MFGRMYDQRRSQTLGRKKKPKRKTRKQRNIHLKARRDRIHARQGGGNINDRFAVEREQLVKSLQEKDDQLTNLRAQLVQQEKIAREAQEKWVRTVAEFDNFRKRREREKQDIVQNANKDLALELLEVIDNLERAIDASPETEGNKSLLDGVKLVYGQLLQKLEKTGIKAMDDVPGSPFDPEKHDAMMQQESEFDSDKIVQIVQKGYYINDKILRHAKVIVSA